MSRRKQITPNSLFQSSRPSLVMMNNKLRILIILSASIHVEHGDIKEVSLRSTFGIYSD